jgi:hypothetical protein
VHEEGPDGQPADATEKAAATEKFAFTPPEVEPRIDFERTRATEPKAKARPKQRLRLRRWQVVTAAITACVLLAAAGWIAHRGTQAAGNLRNAADMFATMQRQLTDGDLAAARSTLVALQKETATAKDKTSGPLWTVATVLPWLGDDLSAVRTITVALDELASGGLPALIDVAAALESGTLAPSAGKIDLAVLRRTTDRLARAAAVVHRATGRVAAIRTAGLTGQVDAAVTQLREALRKAERLIGPAERAAEVLPDLLGADGPRRYLMLFQNLAEVRATGGMPGAFIVVETHDGAVQLIEQGSAAAAIRSFPAPVLPLDPDAEALYSERLGIFPADVNLTPDFPTAARLAREMYRLRSGKTVDGVIATDPVALSYLLRASGPVPMPFGAPLTADSAVRMLLSQIYATATNAQQDAYFAHAARAAFEVLTRPQANPRGLLAELARAAGERRLLLWSADRDLQKNIEGTVLAGALPLDDGAAPTVGVFLNDGSGAKLSYYLAPAATLAVGGCDGDGSRELRLRVTIGSTAPRSGLSEAVLGLGLSGDPYTIRTNVSVFSPTAGAIADATLDGAEAEMGTGVEHGRAVGIVTVDLPPGATKTLAVTLLTGPAPAVTQAGAVRPRLWTTPAVVPWKTDVTAGTPCSK